MDGSPLKFGRPIMKMIGEASVKRSGKEPATQAARSLSCNVVTILKNYFELNAILIAVLTTPSSHGVKDFGKAVS
jgi:hypothetical protein